MAKVPNHAHCRVCSRAIPSSDSFCSTDCRKQAEEQQNKRKRMLYLMYGLFGVGLVIFIVVPLLQQAGIL